MGAASLGLQLERGRVGPDPETHHPCLAGSPFLGLLWAKVCFWGPSESGQRNGVAGRPVALAWYRVECWGERLGAGLVMTEQDGLAQLALHLAAAPRPSEHILPGSLPAPPTPAWRKALWVSPGRLPTACPDGGPTLHTAVPTLAHRYGARLLGLLEPVAPPRAPPPSAPDPQLEMDGPCSTPPWNQL